MAAMAFEAAPSPTSQITNSSAWASRFNRREARTDCYVEFIGFITRRIHRVHHLTGTYLANARKAVSRRVDFIIAQASRLEGPGLFRRAAGVLFVGAHQLESFLLIIRGKVITQNALSHLPHQPMIERHVVNA